MRVPYDASVCLLEKLFLVWAALAGGFSLFMVVGSIALLDWRAAAQIPLLWLLSAAFYGLSRLTRNRRPKFTDGRVKPVSKWIT